MDGILSSLIIRIPYILSGTVINYFVATLQPVRKQSGLSAWKTLLLAFMLTLIGGAGCYIMFRIEAGYWGGGGSAFGGVLFTPLLMMPLMLLHIDYRTLSDIYSTCGGVCLALLKVECMTSGCCGGKVIYRTLYNAYRFPSRLSDMIAGLVLMLCMFRLQKSPKNHGRIYGWFLVFYGLYRFPTQFLRQDNAVMIASLSITHIWSIIAVVGGIIWLLVTRNTNGSQSAAEPSAEPPQAD